MGVAETDVGAEGIVPTVKGFVPADTATDKT